MNFALIFAGGIGRRMNYKDLPKQFLQINGRTIISLTIEKFQKHEDIDGILVVCVDTHIDACKSEVETNGFSKVIDVVPGGVSAQESILLGLRRLKQFDDGNNTVLIHDGVRPLIDEKLISRNIETVEEHGSSVTTVSCNETILFQKNKKRPQYEALDRGSCAIARAPQCYKIDDVLPSAEKAFKASLEFVDTYSLMESDGISAVPVECDHMNIKITTYSDFLMAKVLIEGGV
jgi:2-C-methyl-D-erythritol 4-phosphate cytidylyltransferase